MLGDADLQILDNELDAVAGDDQQHHERLQKLLDQSRDLVESYRLLKSDYEEEKEAREKYKKLARGQVSKITVCMKRSILIILHSGTQSICSCPGRWRRLPGQFIPCIHYGDV